MPEFSGAAPFEGIEFNFAYFPVSREAETTTTDPDTQSTDESGSEQPYCPEIINGDESAVVLDPNCGALAQEEEEQQQQEEEATAEAIQDFEVGFLEQQILEQLIS